MLTFSLLCNICGEQASFWKAEQQEMRSGGFLIWEAAAGRLELEGICSIKIPETIDNFDKYCWFKYWQFENSTIHLITINIALYVFVFVFALVFEFE